MPNSKVEQWLIDNPDVSFNYENLVKLMRSKGSVECVIEINGRSQLARAEYTKTPWVTTFNIVTDEVQFTHSSFNQFINFCEESNVLFSKQDFLESTRKMLEIAKNAAQFKAVSVPLNTPQDVEALLALMDRANAVSPL